MLSNTIRSLNWLGVIAAALFLWSVRFGLLRAFDRATASGSSPVADRGLPRARGYAVGIACLIIAASLAVIQSVFPGDMGSAIGMGFLASIVPAAVLIGVGIESPHKHGTMRAAAVIVCVIVASMIVHAA